MKKALYTILGVAALSVFKNTSKGSTSKMVFKNTDVYKNVVTKGITFSPNLVDQYFLNPQNLPTLTKELFNALKAKKPDLVNINFYIEEYPGGYANEDEFGDGRIALIDLFSTNPITESEKINLIRSFSGFLSKYAVQIEQNDFGNYIDADTDFDLSEPSEQEYSESYEQDDEANIQSLFDNYEDIYDQQDYYSEEQLSEQQSFFTPTENRQTTDKLDTTWSEERKEQIPLLYVNGTMINSLQINKPKSSNIRRR